MTKAFLVRHGETSLNADGRLRGLADPQLNETGERQACAVARALADVDGGIVVSSPLMRAVATASVIARRAGIAHQIDERFNDRDYGPWTGAMTSEVIDQWGTVDAAPGVEPAQAVLLRAQPALVEWAQWAQARRSALIVVTHDAVIRPLLRWIAPTLAPSIRTGSYQVVLHGDDDWQVQLTDQQPPMEG